MTTFASKPPGADWSGASMVALWVAENHAAELRSQLGIVDGVGELHVTILYLGTEGEDFDGALRDQIADIARSTAGELFVDGWTLSSSGASLEYLGDPDDNDGHVAVAIDWAESSNADLWSYRALVEERLAEIGVTNASQFTEFRAHTTLTWLPVTEAEAAFPAGTAMGDDVALAVAEAGVQFGEDRSAIKLQADEVPVDIDVPDAIAASGKSEFYDAFMERIEDRTQPLVEQLEAALEVQAVRSMARLLAASDAFAASGADDATRVAQAAIDRARGAITEAQYQSIVSGLSSVSPFGGFTVVPDTIVEWEQTSWSDFLDDAAAQVRTAVHAEGVLAGLSWTFDSAPVVNIASAHIAMLDELSASARTHLSSVASQALRDGWGVERMAEKLVGGPFDPVAARRYSQTLLIGASNQATAAAFVATAQSGDEKEWLATPDDRTRDTHAAANGQRVAFDAYFSVGGYDAFQPGDPSLPAQEKLNCRCTWIPVTTTGKQAGLVASGAPAMVPTAAMVTEAQRGLRWNDDESVSFAAGAGLVDLAARIAERVELSEGDLGLIVDTWELHQHALAQEGGSYGDDGFPNQARVSIALAGGEAGVEWARRQQRKITRQNYGQKATTMSELQAMATTETMRALLEAALIERFGLSEEGYVWVRDYDADTGTVVFEHSDLDGGMWMIGYNRDGDTVTIDADEPVPAVISYDVASASNEIDMAALAERLVEHLSANGMAITPTAGAEMADGQGAGPGAFVDGDEDDMRPFDWESRLAIEGVMTGDGRRIELGSLTWRTPPLSLMVQLQTAGGHDQSAFAGSIVEIWRDGNEIWGRGWFDSGEGGVEARRMIEEGTVRGISVDLTDLEYEVLGDDGDWMSDVFSITAAKVGAATIVYLPAFEGAEIWLLAPDEGPAMKGMFPIAASGGMFTPTDLEVSAVAASGNPVNELAFAGADAERLLHPPAEWFDFELPGGQPVPFTVTPEGRIFGIIAYSGSCHTGIRDRCQDVPRSPSNYAAFHGEREGLSNFGQAVVCSNGERRNVGHLFFDTDHGDVHAPANVVIDHYGHSGMHGGNVRATDTEWGVAVNGAVTPNVTRGQLYALTSLGVSGHWSPLGGGLELLGIISVNQPGFNLAVAASGRPAVDGRWSAVVASGAVVSLVGGTSPGSMTGDLMAAMSNRLDEVERILRGEPTEEEAFQSRVDAALAALDLSDDARIARALESLSLDA